MRVSVAGHIWSMLISKRKSLLNLKGCNIKTQNPKRANFSLRGKLSERSLGHWCVEHAGRSVELVPSADTVPWRCPQSLSELVSLRDWKHLWGAWKSVISTGARRSSTLWHLRNLNICWTVQVCPTYFLFSCKFGHAYSILINKRKSLLDLKGCNIKTQKIT